jgi:hypothetical protein
MAGTAPKERVLGSVESEPFKAFRFALQKGLIGHASWDRSWQPGRHVQ